MEWHANLSDLNPKENLLSIWVYANWCHFRRKEELLGTLLELSKIITENKILKLTNFIDERPVQVISRNETHIVY